VIVGVAVWLVHLPTALIINRIGRQCASEEAAIWVARARENWFRSNVRSASLLLYPGFTTGEASLFTPLSARNHSGTAAL
jgi:hypothetical protein